MVSVFSPETVYEPTGQPVPFNSIGALKYTGGCEWWANADPATSAMPTLAITNSIAYSFITLFQSLKKKPLPVHKASRGSSI
jgi:hypothetical protein